MTRTLRPVPQPDLPRILPVILAGGSGTRLWPLSREQHPKQLIELVSDESPLSATARRLNGIANASLDDRLLLVCGEQHRFMSAAQVVGRGAGTARILLEPSARNTAPALTLAALDASADADDPVLAVMPADHVIVDVAAFQDAVGRAARYAQDGAIVTLGVLPRRAETGYGYIQVGEPRAGRLGGQGGYAIGRFVEKPDATLAERYLQSGDYWWNSGIFVTRASVWLKAIEALAPEIHAACEAAWRAGVADDPFFRIDAAAFDACPSDSIDYAVMERLADSPTLGIDGIVVPLAAGWSDVGTWDAIWEIMPKDAHGNVARGTVVFEDTHDSLVRSEGRLVACVGMKDVVVIETPDAVLVANKHDGQRVKNIVARLKMDRRPQVSEHRKVQRPWGHYDSIDLGERFQVKRIVVEPGKQLSLQMHYHRAEHWIVVRGTARVTRGSDTFLLSENESTYIAVGEVHRLENPGRIPLEIIEVQSGDYLGEDDIVRFDDQYGRAVVDAGPPRRPASSLPPEPGRVEPAPDAETTAERDIVR
ncbi:mannose-1-phosphate guanylyltransferase/mannose-6-phosphate isomerase [Burkholderia multivorans]|uniref:mannose-1-phosphate guanylyltransferase/mannose-6-phosphate isomerase n=1 Tax=Burkholderia multivorans TaxID=87883 RepID=UPI000F4F3D84|nr:mannose-1-phosphate guanylyltransferase/mannose-6-phosphate isomerase [Burkholderia multivorans]AYY56275.1 mannose-1-phosphate guanylyltransferase/mannose-6-phosphate isomerase [Burkholderia multivorans]MCA8435925.1 mannose-1-phosphate guanylyltransferase/mannose-6-phosphate isomerase [Burkholderia multivorans]